jgi:TonB family protein
MRRRRNIFPIALACSLVLHALGTMIYVAYGSRLLSPDVKTLRNPELVLKVDPELLDFGDAKGKGIGNNSSAGEQSLRAREADADQALLSRQPAGFGKQLEAPSELKGPTGALAMAAPIPAIASPPDPPTERTPDAKTAAASALQAMSSPPHPAPDLSIPQPAAQVREGDPGTAGEPLQVNPKIMEQSPPPPQQRPVQVAAASQNQNPGVPTSAGKPIPQSESDSDPFMRSKGSIEFHNGRLDIQFGRRVKTVNPQIGIAGELDAIALNSPTLIVEVHIEPSGRVSKVELVRKSGSVALDEPTVNAVYQWTFEPARDKNGSPIADVITFSFGYR